MSGHESKISAGLSPAELRASREVASLEEHDRAKQVFLESKANLLSSLDLRLRETGCGSLDTLSYQALKHYERRRQSYSKDPYQVSPMLKVVCEKGERAFHHLGLRVYAEEMAPILELVPIVLQSRESLMEVFEHLSEEDQRSLLPQASIEISGQTFAPMSEVKNEISIDLWQLKAGSEAADYLRDLPTKIVECYPELYNAQIQEALATRQAYLDRPRMEIRQLSSAHSYYAPAEAAVSFFKTQVLEQLLAACIIARDNGDCRLLRAIGQDLNPRNLLPSSRDEIFYDAGLGYTSNLNSWYWEVMAPTSSPEGEYLLYWDESVEIETPVLSLTPA